jgi:hypothetical protein
MLKPILKAIRRLWSPTLPQADTIPQQDFTALKNMGGTFVARSAADFQAYVDWSHRQVCEKCGRPALGPNGKREVPWVTETLCVPCAFPKDPQAKLSGGGPC